MEFIRSRAELAGPETDWEKTWRLARLPGLGPEHTSFLFKMIHQILPTQEILFRTNNGVNNICKVPGCNEVDDLCHSLVLCESNQQIGSNLMELLRHHQPSLSNSAALRLELEVDEEVELPLVWIMAATLVSIWDQKKTKNRVIPHLTRSELEAKINILRETRLASMVNTLEEMIIRMF